MSENSSNEPKTEHAEIIPAAAASELNNLLQIIAGTAAMLENIWEGRGAEKYFDMLRLSVDRAARVTAQLVKQVGGTNTKVLLRPELAAFAKQVPVSRQPREKLGASWWSMTSRWHSSSPNKSSANRLRRGHRAIRF